MREHRGSAAPRMISRVRGDKVMQPYSNSANKNSVQMLYGGQRGPDSQGSKLVGNIGGRRNKSTVRGAQLQPLEIDNSGISRQGQHMLKRNNSKPQL